MALFEFPSFDTDWSMSMFDDEQRFERDVCMLMGRWEVSAFIFHEDFLDLLFGFTVLVENENWFSSEFVEMKAKEGWELGSGVKPEEINQIFIKMREYILQSVAKRLTSLKRLETPEKHPALGALKSPIVFFFSCIIGELGRLIWETTSKGLCFDLSRKDFVCELHSHIEQLTTYPLELSYIESMSSLPGLQIASDELVAYQIAKMQMNQSLMIPKIDESKSWKEDSHVSQTVQQTADIQSSLTTAKLPTSSNSSDLSVFKNERDDAIGFKENKVDEIVKEEQKKEQDHFFSSFGRKLDITPTSGYGFNIGFDGVDNYYAGGHGSGSVGFECCECSGMKTEAQLEAPSSGRADMMTVSQCKGVMWLNGVSVSLDRLISVFGQRVGDALWRHWVMRCEGRSPKGENKRFREDVLVVLKMWYEEKKKGLAKEIMRLMDYGSLKAGEEDERKENEEMDRTTRNLSSLKSGTKVIGVYGSKEERRLLGIVTGLTNIQITNWISNMRNRDPLKKKLKKELKRKREIKEKDDFADDQGVMGKKEIDETSEEGSGFGFEKMKRSWSIGDGLWNESESLKNCLS
ncbi:uncharacterized protein MONOS_1103 [Monocercomonoides exilis]|uniref:uncharacterized protein n=1 Tax=Monocercomonoides exilis TaxID=2049356 RepID=UPI00355993CB|nr:hypothetical protein MONOS_1103 [Monocercomonoides exilis]|eukprot:MONOS_1103.1-p1 / transcript=MONOS_1103.1 / gene=MONOS_1103 / organism=Monocercomonoides_exilis_PA203 / gene_product=unspecified product / transcript_product=unspecified product / location=Mono_scaffold00018:223488-225313(-) / protein_length=576 / sequence_SO=supercontig / SO=protein_coding / is_pseudo=false